MQFVYLAFQDNDVSNIFSTSGTAAPQLWKHKPGESIEESMDDTTFLTDNEE